MNANEPLPDCPELDKRCSIAPPKVDICFKVESSTEKDA